MLAANERDRGSRREARESEKKREEGRERFGKRPHLRDERESGVPSALRYDDDAATGVERRRKARERERER